MLVMSKGALTAAQAETYYEEKYSQDDYYSEKQRVIGEWFGRAAEQLASPARLPPKTSAPCCVGFALHPPRYSFKRRTATKADAQGGMRPSTRSEERRVGKECRSRW